MARWKNQWEGRAERVDPESLVRLYIVSVTVSRRTQEILPPTEAGGTTPEIGFKWALFWEVGSGETDRRYRAGSLISLPFLRVAIGS